MKIESNVTIRAAPMAIWPYIADPLVMATWNPKIISIDRDAKSTVVVGERFTMLCRLSEHERTTQVEVVRSEPGFGVTYRHRFVMKDTERIIEERYDLRAEAPGGGGGGGTRVEQVIDMSQAQIPAAIRVLMGLITRFGESTEKEYLERLKELVEQDRQGGQV